jgi:hypothetical protein
MELRNENRERIKDELREWIRGWDVTTSIEGFESHLMPKVIEMGLEWDGCEWFHSSIMSRVWIEGDGVQLEINVKDVEGEGLRILFRSR